MTAKKPQCFLSYSWDTETHKDWVATLAAAIAERGIDVRFDRWDAPPGLDLARFMETCVAGSTHVLVVCTKQYADKANQGSGGVGYEKMVITGEIMTGMSPDTKFVPILRSGTAMEAIPVFLRSKKYIDFTDDGRFLQSLDELTRHIRFAGLRSDAFVLGTIIVVNINAVSEEPRQNDRVHELWRSINGLCRNLGLEEPAIPGRNGVVGGDRAFKETMPVLEELKQKIAKEYGPSMMNPFWLGSMSALAGQFMQNPALTAMGAPLFREVERLSGDCSVADKVVRPFLEALKSGQPDTVIAAIMSFTSDVSDALEKS